MLSMLAGCMRLMAGDENLGITGMHLPQPLPAIVKKQDDAKDNQVHEQPLSPAAARTSEINSQDRLQERQSLVDVNLLREIESHTVEGIPSDGEIHQLEQWASMLDKFLEPPSPLVAHQNL